MHRPALALLFLVASSALPALASGSSLQVERQPIVDRRQGGMVVSTVAVPKGWKLTSDVQWRYQDVSWPVRIHARVESPDGSAWVEFFPAEFLYWLEPGRDPLPVGARALGMTHAPGFGIDAAMKSFVIRPNRGRAPGLRIVSSRTIHGLAEAFHQKSSPGDERAYRLTYQLRGKPVEEDLFGMLGAPARIPYTGPQGTTYEVHRGLYYVHSMGAMNGQLASVRPLLAFIAGSVTVDPAWQKRREQVVAQLAEQFNRALQAGYAQIAAAGAASKAISAQNDAMLSSMSSQRQVQAQREAVKRATANASPRGGDEFDGYIRGTTKMKDPYWGESEQSSNASYHWTDGQGTYRSSNDPSFDPNVGAGGGANWQRMEPAGK